MTVMVIQLASSVWKQELQKRSQTWLDERRDVLIMGTNTIAQMVITAANVMSARNKQTVGVIANSLLQINLRSLCTSLMKSSMNFIVAAKVGSEMAIITLQEFLDEKFVAKNFLVRPRVVCDDGFIVSVQASSFHYCAPRVDQTDSVKSVYSMLELGYPSEIVKELLPYAEVKEMPTNTVYAYVPFTLVEEVLNKHGGINIKKTRAFAGIDGE